jgi:hypothetical protein
MYPQVAKSFDAGPRALSGMNRAWLTFPQAALHPWCHRMIRFWPLRQDQIA